METEHSVPFKLSREASSRYVVSEYNAKLKVPENTEYAIQNEQPEASEKNSSWSETCRVCANKNDHIIPIFEGEGAEHDLCNKIHKYLPIQVSKADTLPKQLCYHCAATILAWHDLLEGCVEAEKKLLSMEAELNDKERLTFEYIEIPISERLTAGNTAVSEELVDDPESQPSQEKESACSMEKIEENETIERPASPESEERSETKKPFKIFLDTKNISQTSRKIMNEKHEDVIWKDVLYTSIEQQFTNLESPIVADEDSECCIEEVSKDEETSLSKAESIEKETENTEDQESKQDERDGKAKCNDCSLEVHKDSPEARKTYQCVECAKSFRLKDSFVRHLRIHRDERPFTCHVCGKQFRDSGGLSRHLKDVHAKLKNFPCDICVKCFSSKATRDDHRRTHTGERPYVCETCNKSFKSKACLYSHSKLHTSEFPHPCAYCNKKFRRRQEMLVHATTHTGEKNYSCDICYKRFRVKTEVVRHKLTHSDEKPFVCAKCGLRFRQNRYLNNHIKTRHAGASSKD